ncbi:hypothetical protein E2C01_004159 [Portunus trituberculatus]|uniref:Uncharacterized protein n=1 Tax=Portunus trituberculatus TaxID=210409 RepID=A0A5B7CP61_PORTR|nr:hypothetical protein [Portunus trituberculatus]
MSSWVGRFAYGISLNWMATWEGGSSNCSGDPAASGRPRLGMADANIVSVPPIYRIFGTILFRSATEIEYPDNGVYCSAIESIRAFVFKRMLGVVASSYSAHRVTARPGRREGVAGGAPHCTCPQGLAGAAVLLPSQIAKVREVLRGSGGPASTPRR